MGRTAGENPLFVVDRGIVTAHFDRPAISEPGLHTKSPWSIEYAVPGMPHQHQLETVTLFS